MLRTRCRTAAAPLIVTMRGVMVTPVTGWLGEFDVPMTSPGKVATAFRLFSQLTGPTKCTLHGLGLGVPGHVARVFEGSSDQPLAARALTTTGSSTACNVSIVTAIGGGFWTLTSCTVVLPTMFNLTAEPGSAPVASTVATVLLVSTLLITSASPA